MKSVIKSFNKIYKYFPHISVYFIIQCIIGILRVISPTMYSKMVAGIMNRELSEFSKLMSLMAITFTLILIVGAFSYFLELYIKKNAKVEIKNTLFSNVLELPISYLKRMSSGKLFQILYEDCNCIVDMAFVIITLLINVLIVIFMGINVVSINIYLSMLIILHLPITIVLNHKAAKNIKKEAKQLREETDYHITYLRKVIADMEQIIPTNMQQSFEKKYFDQTKELKKKGIELSRMEYCNRTIIRILDFLNKMLFWGIGGYLVISETINVEKFILFNAYSQMLTESIMKIINSWSGMQPMIIAIERVMEVFEEYENYCVKEKSNIRALEDNKTTIEIEDLSVSYGDNHVLKDFCFDFESGKSYAVVGKNGAGKTTLFKALSKILDFENGSIKVNGQEIKDIDNREWYQYITYIPHEPVLFGTTIKDNMLFFENADKVDLSEIESLAKEMHIYGDLLAKTDGLDTILTDEVTLSFGQKQKISLIRACLDESKIVLLDEPLTGIDNASKSDVIEIIRKLAKEKLVILISHNPEEYSFVDCIVNLG